MDVNPDVSTRAELSQPVPGPDQRDAFGDRPLGVVIEPTRGWAALGLSELWRFHELLYFLTWRDIKVRYKQTVIGAGWAVLQPFLTMVVFAIVFGRLAGVPSDGVPYPVFAYAGLLPWTFFATAFNNASMSLVNNAGLVSKVYFPRLTLPIATVLAAGVDFLVAFVVLLAMMFFYGVVPGVAMLSLPLFLLLMVMTVLSTGLWFSALNVKYRDIRYTVPFLIQFWLFITPVAYPSSLIPERWRVLYGLNPMAGVVEGYRWALLGTDNAPGMLLAVSTIVVVILFLGGLLFFRRMEREFADVI